MEKIPTDGIVEWLGRFCHFNDAVIRRWAFDFDGEAVTLEIDVESQDSIHSSSGWSCVTNRLDRCRSLRFANGPKSDYSVLSNGMHAVVSDGLVGLEFGDFVHAPASLAELQTSACHAVAAIATWAVREVHR